MGSTIRTIQERIAEHMRAVRLKDLRYPVALHSTTCDVSLFRFHAIEHVKSHPRGGNRELQLRRREAIWISRLHAVQCGINVDHEMHYFLGDN